MEYKKVLGGNENKPGIGRGGGKGGQRPSRARFTRRRPVPENGTPRCSDGPRGGVGNCRGVTRGSVRQIVFHEKSPGGIPLIVKGRTVAVPHNT